MADVLPVSVLVPTIGRPRLLARCLTSVAECVPRAAEILVVDQSGSAEVAAVVERFADVGSRLVPCSGIGKSRGANLGMREAAHDLVLFTDDDCTVDRAWVAIADRLTADDPAGIVTGRVIPEGDPDAVPSTIEDELPRDYDGDPRPGLLYWGNMAASPSALLALGGFDERMTLSAADNDLCYRWLASGRRLHYRPELVVWHHEWRTSAALEQLYVTYAVGTGMFYAKHLRQRDFNVLRFLAQDVYYAAHGIRARLRGVPRSADWRQGLAAGIPRGLYQGWRTFGPGAAGAADCRR